MTTARQAMVAWVDRRIDDILRAPPMWGSDEAVELQVLQLLEMRDAAQNPTAANAQPRRVLERYAEFLRSRRPRKVGPAAVIAPGAELAPLLRAFADTLRAELQPENPFEIHDLAIRLTFSDHKRAAASAVSTYIDGLRRAVRAVAGKGSAGRPARGIGQATDYALEDLELAPPNGAAGTATVCLGAARSQRDFEAEERVRDGFSKLIAVTEWAAHDTPLGALQLSDASRVALQAQRLLPSAGIDQVELGGRLLARPSPVIFRASQRRRLLEVATSGATQEPFEREDEIRALDLDRGTISIGKQQRVECFAAPDLLELVTEVGVTAKIVGTLIKRIVGKPFVVVDSLTVPERPLD
ncbi:MAG: hypothetical protein INH41_02370 [Myxococcaceae bacterium]|jgi:hypothetical protein|nr:hypothetical protein [Myxococcaceae bacterium]MCA3011224.1 hypothetical protein [Myxococcaceae bacterium]